MTTNSHANCSHAATKPARAACRRTRAAESIVGDAVALAAQGTYWPRDMVITGHDDDDYDRSGMFSNE